MAVSQCPVCLAKSGATVKVQGQKRCASCGTVVREVKPSVASNTRPKCPKCGRSRARRWHDGRWLCPDCSALFETESEVGFLDTRPDVNAMKREQQQPSRAKNGGRR